MKQQQKPDFVRCPHLWQYVEPKEGSSVEAWYYCQMCLMWIKEDSKSEKGYVVTAKQLIINEGKQ